MFPELLKVLIFEKKWITKNQELNTQAKNAQGFFKI